MPEFIQGPEVWRRRELLARLDFSQTLGEDEIAELSRAAEQPTEDLESITATSFSFPKLSRRLAEIQQTLECGSGAAMIRGFPIEQISEEQVERILFCMVQQVGTPVSQTGQGERLFMSAIKVLPWMIPGRGGRTLASV